MIDIFEKYASYYDDPVVRPQPTDFVLEYFKNVSYGFFIDVGAHNGITWNNTLALSELHEWRGICIEAHPIVFESLVKNRPYDTCLNIGSHNNNGGKLFRQIEGYAEMLSGFIATYNPEHVERIRRDIANHGGTAKETVVQVEKLCTTITNNTTNQPIDYLSIDVEGAELVVLEGLHIEVNRPRLISVEDNGYTNEAHNYLVSNNYKFLEKIAGDCFYENSIL